jgi:hypothetical protein
MLQLVPVAVYNPNMHKDGSAANRSFARQLSTHLHLIARKIAQMIPPLHVLAGNARMWVRVWDKALARLRSATGEIS